MEMRDLAAAGKVWAFNGIAGMPDRPLLEASRGETVRLTMVNDTAWPHAMHLHGHHFRVLGPNGPGPLRDTTLMERGETAEIAFVADNPGRLASALPHARAFRRRHDDLAARRLSVRRRPACRENPPSVLPSALPFLDYGA